MNLLIGNLKMNIISRDEREKYFAELEKNFAGKNFENTEIILCPPFIHLETFARKLKDKSIGIGGQNIYEEESGRFTGEISAPMVKNFGGEYVIIGHSERRTIFGETDKMVNEKVKAAIKSGLISIMCIGETIKDREKGEVKNVISSQLLNALNDIPKDQVSKMIIAYEPVWSIGTGKIPTADEVMEVRILMQKILVDNYAMQINELPALVYGGSVNAGNVRELCLDSGMNGVLVGGESLRPADFIKIGEVLDKK